MAVAVVDSDMTDAARPLRLGFPVKVMGKPGLKSNDTRRWQKGPHLKCSLEEVDRILDHLKAHDLNMYRLSSDLAPYATHPNMPQFHRMVAESDAELRAFGRKRVNTTSVCRSIRRNMCCSTAPIPT